MRISDEIEMDAVCRGNLPTHKGMHTCTCSVQAYNAVLLLTASNAALAFSPDLRVPSVLLIRSTALWISPRSSSSPVLASSSALRYLNGRIAGSSREGLCMGMTVYMRFRLVYHSIGRPVNTKNDARG
jgi:hypothetical protein